MKSLMSCAILAVVLAAPAVAGENPAAAEPAAPASAVVPAAAQNKAAASLVNWFKHWKTALEKSAVEGRYRRTRTTAVAAVRGAGQKEEDPGKPYFKGSLSDKALAQLMKEREELQAAVALILEGKLQEGRAKLDAFEKAYPKSRLVADVREAQAKLVELQSENKAQSAPAPTVEAAPAAAAPAPKPAELAPAAPEKK